LIELELPGGSFLGFLPFLVELHDVAQPGAAFGGRQLGGLPDELLRIQKQQVLGFRVGLPGNLSGSQPVGGLRNQFTS